MNGAAGSQEIEDACGLDAGTRRFVRDAMERTGISARGFHRLLRVARTIADLDGESVVGEAQVAEAFQFRRGVWES